MPVRPGGITGPLDLAKAGTVLVLELYEIILDSPFGPSAPTLPYPVTEQMCRAVAQQRQQCGIEGDG